MFRSQSCLQGGQINRVSGTKTSGALSFLFFLAILLAPFQNTALSQTFLRFLGASLSFLPIALFCLFSFISRILNRQAGAPEKGLFLFLLYTVAISILGMVTIETSSVETSFLIKKILTNTILNILLIYPIFVAPTPSKWFAYMVSLALGLTITGYILVDVFNISFFEFPSFLNSVWGPTIPSGFSSEQSTFAATICVLSLLSLALAQTRMMRWFYVFILLLFVTVLSHSKGTTLCLILAFGCSFLFSGRKGTGGFLIKLCGIFFAVILSFFVYDQMSERFQHDIESSSSSSTRSILILSSIPAVAANPWGVGYANYIPAIIEYTPQTAEWVREYLIPNAPTREIESYILREDKEALNIKAQFFEYFMVFGLPGLFFLTKFHIFLYRRIIRINGTNRESFLLLFWFLVFSLSSYMPSLGLYFYTVAYAVLLKGPSLLVQETDKSTKTPLFMKERSK